MAQTGYSKVQIYSSSTATHTPSAGNLTNDTNGSELAINITDGKLFYKDNSGTVQVLATKGSGVVGGSNTQVQYNSSGTFAGSANLTFDGTTLTSSGFSGPLNGTVGATTANTGAFTTLSASSTVSGTGFSTYLASPPAIGGTAAAAVTGTIVKATTNFTFQDNTTQNTAATGFGFKNRIINGAMTVNQYNGTSTTTPSTAGANVFPIDRWSYYASQASKFTFSQDTNAPVGFGNSLKCLVASAVTVVATDRFSVNQVIEGLNFYDFAFGTASAKPVTISFWVYSSLTGTFSGSMLNYACNRSYPFTYTIYSANTWEQKTVTIAGDTSGSWSGATNSGGAYVFFSLGMGSNYKVTAGSWQTGTYLGAIGETPIVGSAGATWYVTGVQLEKGSTATSFDYRPYGTELNLCQRYYYQFIGPASGTNYVGIASGLMLNTTIARTTLIHKVPMRTSPTITPSASTTISAQAGTIASSVNSILAYTGSESALIEWFLNNAGTAGQGAAIFSVTNTGFLTLSAEL
jgi:membrane-bound inhibitor of C-type lysozyme